MPGGMRTTPHGIEVRVRGDEQVISIDVVDDGGPAGSKRSAGSGFGIPGMRERAEMLGATSQPARARAGLAGDGHDSAEGATMNDTLRIIVADDHDLVRVGLVTILNAQPASRSSEKRERATKRSTSRAVCGPTPASWTSGCRARWHRGDPTTCRT